MEVGRLILNFICAITNVVIEMNYYKNIQELIEKDIVLKKKHRLIEEHATLKTYYDIGKNIVEAQGGETRAQYGNGLIKKWSKTLTEKYGKGYNISNLKRMRQFYLAFPKGAPLAHQLTWTNLSIILPIKEESKRNYYINMCIKQNLTKRQLLEKIKNNEYERLEYKESIQLIIDNKELTIKDMMKDPILIKVDKDIDKLSEKALKEFILSEIESFLLEMGCGFTYYGSEVRLGNYKCDLLFFNYELNSFIVVELKIRKLRPQDVGQIHLYTNYIDAHNKKEYMNETIGIILCKENNRIVPGYMTDEKTYYSTYKLVNNND